MIGHYPQIAGAAARAQKFDRHPTDVVAGVYTHELGHRQWQYFRVAGQGDAIPDDARDGPANSVSTFRLRRTEPSEGSNLGRTFLALLSFLTVGAADTDGSRWEVEEIDRSGVCRTVFTHKERYAAEFEMTKLRAAQAER